jgi:hypothetical protein
MTLKSRPSLIVLIQEKFSAWSLCHGKKQMTGTQLKADLLSYRNNQYWEKLGFNVHV